MKILNSRPSIFLILLPFGLFFFIFSQCSNKKTIDKYNTTQDKITTDEKQKGMHLFGLRDTIDLQALIQNNIEWITLVAWGDQSDHKSSTMKHHNGDSLQIRRRDSSWISRIKIIKEAGFKVFVKPHVWIHSPSAGKWRSDIFPTDEKNWRLWQESYRDFILRYAKIAEQAKAEMFCVGTELSRLSVEKSAFWEKLIQEVRTIYTGKITYAANWYQEFEKITFWDQLDFIGIQAYFPLVKNKNPTIKDISKGWNRHLPTIKSMHKKYNRKILFTEMGYKSTAGSAIKPWEWLENAPSGTYTFSPETQANCYQAFFHSIWQKKWFAGVHIWQMRSGHTLKHGAEDLDFTPRGKAAERVIAKGFE